MAVVVKRDQGFDHARIEVGSGAFADHGDHHAFVDLAAIGAPRGHGVKNIGKGILDYLNTVQWQYLAQFGDDPTAVARIVTSVIDELRKRGVE